MSTDKIYNGIVIYYNVIKGYGFIKPQGEIPEFSGDNIFFHKQDMQSETQDYIKVGSEVSFSLGQDLRGRIKAINIYIFQPPVTPLPNLRGE